MPFPLHQLALVALIMTLGSVVQGAVGFASGLLGVPLLALSGFSLLEATVINFVSTSVQNVVGAAQLWSHLDRRELVWPNVVRCAMLPLGVLALAGTQHLDRQVVNQLIGGVLFGSVVMLTLLRVEPRPHLPAAWSGLAFLTSGFLTGFAAIGGAPMVCYVNSLTWSAAKSRAFLFFCSAVLIPVLGPLLGWKFGAAVGPPALAAIMAMPLIIVGLAFGLKLGHRLDKARFRSYTYALLTIIALGAILSPLLSAGD